MVTLCVLVAMPPAFVAVTVMTRSPIPPSGQAKVAESLRPLLVCDMGTCPVACQANVIGSVAVMGLTVAVKV